MNRLKQMIARAPKPRPHIYTMCDHSGLIKCAREVKRAPRIVVPAAPGILDVPMKVMTTLHYCDEHAWDFDPATYWTDKQKARLERYARDHGRGDFKPNFERSFIEHVLVTTPEYQNFLWKIGLGRKPHAA